MGERRPLAGVRAVLEPALNPSPAALRLSPLNALHLELGARMVAFAGHSLPVQYSGAGAGLLAEHHHTRQAASLFDVSHMGQVLVSGPEAATALESLMPMDVLGLAEGKQRYGLLLDEAGGILDDLMFLRLPGAVPTFALVVNGACAAADIAHLQARIGTRCEVAPQPQLALLALQGPRAVDALARLVPGVAALVFMTGGRFDWQGVPLTVTRSGYTGEDGFEVSVPAAQAEALARALLAQPEVRPAGLGARNSLRLEAGLCLHGQDIHTGTTPAEAALGWAIPKLRRLGGERAGGFPGADRVLAQLAGPVDALPGRLVGLKALERVPVREHVALHDADGTAVGEITSGLLSPSLDQPVALARVQAKWAPLGSRLNALVRGKPVAMEVCALPFVPHRYHRG